MTVELWLGNEFEHAHEMRALRAILNQMVEHFTDSKDLYLLLGNFYCDGADIDLTIIKKNAVIILELKECDAPVTGGPNGNWQINGGTMLNEGRLNPGSEPSGSLGALKLGKRPTLHHNPVSHGNMISDDRPCRQKNGYIPEIKLVNR